MELSVNCGIRYVREMAGYQTAPAPKKEHRLMRSLGTKVGIILSTRT